MIRIAKFLVVSQVVRFTLSTRFKEMLVSGASQCGMLSTATVWLGRPDCTFGASFAASHSLTLFPLIATAI